MTATLDLDRFVQRRQFRSLEQNLARTTYAYGVALRRFQWLTDSMTAQTLMRAHELRWTSVAETLMRDVLQAPEGAVTLPFLQEIVTVAELLRVSLPTVRLVHPDAAAEWPLVTPLGNARGSDDWLILNLNALSDLSPPERAFLLGQGLGHIQCGQAALFLAHFLSHHDDRNHLAVRALLRPFSKLAAFSADRAGLLAAGAFEPARAMLTRTTQALPPWYPTMAGVDVRMRALEDFDHSRVVARTRSHQRFAAEHPSVSTLVHALIHSEGDNDTTTTAANAEGARPAGPTFAESGYEIPADAWPLARCDQRLTQRLGIF